MGKFIRRFRQWLARLAAPIAPTNQIETMSLQDWADLPPHHPQCD